MKFWKWLSMALALCVLATSVPSALAEGLEIEYAEDAQTEISEEVQAADAEESVEEVSFELGGEDAQLEDDVTEDFSSNDVGPLDDAEIFAKDGGPVGPYDDQIRENYKKALEKLISIDGRSSFDGWCGQYVRYQLEVNGINYVSSTNTFNGNEVYYGLVPDAVTSTHYVQKKYEGNNCLYDIIKDYGNKVERIVVSWKHQSGHTDSNPGNGHTHFIYGIIDNIVYLSESYSSMTYWGFSEGDPIALPIDQFMDRYNSTNGAAIGAVLYLPEKRITNLELSDTDLTINISKPDITRSLRTTISPQDATIQTLEWKSDNNGVATVSDTGLVTAVSPGTATITCSATDGSGATATCNVHVVNFRLDKEEIKDTYIGYTDTLVGLEGDLPVSTTFSVTGGDASVVKLTKAGKITTKKAGTVVITGTSKTGETATCTVSVRPNPSSAVITSTGSAIEVGGKITPVLTIKPENAYTTVTWSTDSKGQKIVQVNESTGEVEGLAAGTAVVTATVKGLKNKPKLTIIVHDPHEPSSLTLTYGSDFDGKTLDLEQKLVLGGTLSPETAVTDVVWTASPKNAVTLTPSTEAVRPGRINTVVVTPLKAGSVTITATSTKNKKIAAKLKFTIKDLHAPKSVSIDQGKSLSLSVGDARTLTATVKGDGYEPRKDLIWKSNKPSVVYVDEKTGEIAALTSGSAKITVTTDNKKKATISVKVNPAASATATVDLYDYLFADGAATAKTLGLKKTDKSTGDIKYYNDGVAVIAELSQNGGVIYSIQLETSDAKYNICRAHIGMTENEIKSTLAKAGWKYYEPYSEPGEIIYFTRPYKDKDWENAIDVVLKNGKATRIGLMDCLGE